jgi:hypothetical protein
LCPILKMEHSMRIRVMIAIAISGLVAIGAAAVVVGSWRTERAIAAFEARVAEMGRRQPGSAFDAARLAELPEPVRRYFAFAFPNGEPSRAAFVRLSAEGQFRRPLTAGFQPTTAAQVIAIGAPALMFSATTPIIPGVWARAYDFFADGRMEMKAKILSTVTVVNESETPALDRISLRRGLLESALYPDALLPGGPVTWSAIDATSARATITAAGLSAAMVAHFGPDGSLSRMAAEEDGDLTTPYHGSGEDVTRADYRLVEGRMIPHRFVISRAAKGEVFPFWDGAITAVRFEPP